MEVPTALSPTRIRSNETPCKANVFTNRCLQNCPRSFEKLPLVPSSNHQFAIFFSPCTRYVHSFFFFFKIHLL